MVASRCGRFLLTSFAIVMACSAVGCSNRANKFPHPSCFRFPKEETRCQQWVVNCRRADLIGKTSAYLNKNCRLCEIHFEDSQFMRAATRDKLVWNAVPTLFQEVPNPPKRLMSSRRPPKERIPLMCPQQHDEDVAGGSSDCTPSPLDLQVSTPCKENDLRKEVQKLRMAKHRLQKKVNLQTTTTARAEELTPGAGDLSAEKIVEAARSFGLSEACCSFFLGQLQNCKRKFKGQRWTDENKAVALGVYFRSRQAYAILENIFTMPSASTLHRFVRGVPTCVGFSDSIFELLAVKSKVMDESARCCVVMFDEMSLRTELSYDRARDTIDGLVELPHKQAVPCNEALVFMVRGLSVNWKQTLGFFFSRNAAGASDLRRLLMIVVKRLRAIDLQPMAVVCDQASTNRSLYSSLGVTCDKPYFDCDGIKMFALYDPPHILKNIRNALKRHGVLFGNNKMASWEDVAAFYHVDSRLPVRLAPKLTAKHVFLPPFSPMRVNLAAQVCSQTVYAGMSVLVSLGKLRPEAAMTAEFLRSVNDVFDILNVRAFDTKAVGPLGLNSGGQLERINCLKEEATTWKVAGKTTFSRQPCFDGLIQDLNAVQQMHQCCVVDGPLNFMLTGRLNQDCIENLFAQVRAKGCHRFNPSAREFRFAFRSLCSNMILASIPSANCAFDSDVMLTSLSRLSRTACRKSEVTAEGGEKPAKVARLTEDAVHLVDAKDFEVPAEICNILTYIAGYLVQKLQKSEAFNCHQCMPVLTVTDSNTVDDSQLYLHLRAYTYKKSAFGGLTAPSVGLVQILQQVENLFVDKIERLLASNHLLADMTAHVHDHVALTTLAVCPIHKDIVKGLVATYLRCRVVYYFKYETRKLTQIQKNKRCRKAQAVLHQ